MQFLISILTLHDPYPAINNSVSLSLVLKLLQVGLVIRYCIVQLFVINAEEKNSQGTYKDQCTKYEENSPRNLRVG